MTSETNFEFLKRANLQFLDLVIAEKDGERVVLMVHLACSDSILLRADVTNYSFDLESREGKQYTCLAVLRPDTTCVDYMKTAKRFISGEYRNTSYLVIAVREPVKKSTFESLPRLQMTSIGFDYLPVLKIICDKIDALSEGKK